MPAIYQSSAASAMPLFSSFHGKTASLIGVTLVCCGAGWYTTARTMDSVSYRRGSNDLFHKVVSLLLSTRLPLLVQNLFAALPPRKQGTKQAQGNDHDDDSEASVTDVSEEEDDDDEEEEEDDDDDEEEEATRDKSQDLKSSQATAPAVQQPKAEEQHSPSTASEHEHPDSCTAIEKPRSRFGATPLPIVLPATTLSLSSSPLVPLLTLSSGSPTNVQEAAVPPTIVTPFTQKIKEQQLQVREESSPSAGSPSLRKPKEEQPIAIMYETPKKVHVITPMSKETVEDHVQEASPVHEETLEEMESPNIPSLPVRVEAPSVPSSSSWSKNLLVADELTATTCTNSGVYDYVDGWATPVVHPNRSSSDIGSSSSSSNNHMDIPTLCEKAPTTAVTDDADTVSSLESMSCTTRVVVMRRDGRGAVPVVVTRRREHKQRPPTRIPTSANGRLKAVVVTPRREQLPHVSRSTGPNVAVVPGWEQSPTRLTKSIGPSSVKISQLLSSADYIKYYKGGNHTFDMPPRDRPLTNHPMDRDDDDDENSVYTA